MSEQNRKRMEYKRRWIANFRSQRHTEENRSSSEDEQHSSNQTSCESPQSTECGASRSTPIHNTSELLQFSDMSESIDGAKHTCCLHNSILLETVRTMLKKNCKQQCFDRLQPARRKEEKAIPEPSTLQGTVMKVHKVERGPVGDVLIEVLKHAPHLPGGPNHIKKKRRPTASVSRHNKPTLSNNFYSSSVTRSTHFP